MNKNFYSIKRILVTILFITSLLVFSSCSRKASLNYHSKFFGELRNSTIRFDVDVTYTDFDEVNNPEKKYNVSGFAWVVITDINVVLQYSFYKDDKLPFKGYVVYKDYNENYNPDTDKYPFNDIYQYAYNYNTFDYDIIHYNYDDYINLRHIPFLYFNFKDYKYENDPDSEEFIRPIDNNTPFTDLKVGSCSNGKTGCSGTKEFRLCYNYESAERHFKNETEIAFTSINLTTDITLPME